MTTAHDFAFTSIDGAELPLASFRGKAVLVVNTASACGLTPQYEGLQKLYSDHREEGLVVLGVPCNQFMGQEPGTEAEIKSFCETRFSVDFPLTSKVEVKGDNAHPFYAWAHEVLGESAVPIWNFHKILIGRNGEAVRAFDPRTTPDAPELAQAVNEALKG